MNKANSRSDNDTLAPRPQLAATVATRNRLLDALLAEALAPGGVREMAAPE